MSWQNPPYYVTAYGLAVKRGFHGSEEEWLASLRGETGKSAYQYALEAGFEGSEELFRESQLNNGKTAYEYAVEGGYTGTKEDFSKMLASEHLKMVIGGTAPTKGPALWFNTNQNGTGESVNLLKLTPNAEDNEVTAVVDEVAYGVENATVNKNPTAGTYDFTVL